MKKHSLINVRTLYNILYIASILHLKFQCYLLIGGSDRSLWGIIYTLVRRYMLPEMSNLENDFKDLANNNFYKFQLISGI